jgi:type VI protein secretion system component VasK
VVGRFVARALLRDGGLRGAAGRGALGMMMIAVVVVAVVVVAMVVRIVVMIAVTVVVGIVVMRAVTAVVGIVVMTFGSVMRGDRRRLEQQHRKAEQSRQDKHDPQHRGPELHDATSIRLSRTRHRQRIETARRTDLSREPWRIGFGDGGRAYSLIASAV